MTANETGKTTYEYDDAGRLIRYKWIVPCGDASVLHTETTTYDDDGRAIEVVKTSEHLFRLDKAIAAASSQIPARVRRALAERDAEGTGTP